MSMNAMARAAGASCVEKRDGRSERRREERAAKRELARIRAAQARAAQRQKQK